MATCTICGVSFPKPEQVRGHIQGSAGEHAGIGFADAKEYISTARVEDEDEAEPAGDPPADPPSSPSKDEGLGVPQRQADPAADEQDSESNCPNCGSNRWFDASEHTDYERACADCSDADSWVVYDP